MTALLAFASALLIGSADFLGGLASRTANGIRVATFGAIVGLPPALLLSIVYGAERVDDGDVAWSLISGFAVGIGIGCFYTAMGRGLISVVAPVAAVTGAIVPVAYDLVRGERPGAIAVLGLVIAFVAVAVISIAPSEQHADAGVIDTAVIALSLASGLFFGLFYVAFSRVSEDAGMWPVTLERCAATGVLVILAISMTRGPIEGLRRLLPYVLAIAVLELAATVPLLLALQRGPVAIASVIASLYPATTVILAGVVLHERLSRLQRIGIGCALAAVVLVSSG